jgi:hypothetical protein
MTDDKNSTILLEDRNIYDGWCAKFNPETRDITWRDAWFANKLSEDFKRQWEKDFLESYLEDKI